MTSFDSVFDFEDLHPIDMVQDIAATQKWKFDRIGEDQIAMAVEGQWRTYSITLAWSDMDETLRLICTFDMQPPQHRVNELYAALNEVNDNCWAGNFTYWADQKSMDQIDTMISTAVISAERYYPAFQLVTWGEQSLKSAMQVAIAEAYGRA